VTLLDDALKDIEKQFGKGSVMSLTDPSAILVAASSRSSALSPLARRPWC
jgi:hypothetical protein